MGAGSHGRRHSGRGRQTDTGGRPGVLSPGPASQGARTGPAKNSRGWVATRSWAPPQSPLPPALEGRTWATACWAYREAPTIAASPTSPGPQTIPPLPGLSRRPLCPPLGHRGPRRGGHASRASCQLPSAPSSPVRAKEPAPPTPHTSPLLSPAAPAAQGAATESPEQRKVSRLLGRGLVSAFAAPGVTQASGWARSLFPGTLVVV